MFSSIYKKIIFAVAFVMIVGISAATAYANHAWGNYHWARTQNPFILKLGDNVTSQWDAYLQRASSDWSTSTVMDTLVVTGGTNARFCRATSGRIEVCNSKYGSNGWLGVASIWANGDHITQATVKLNDTYFNTVKYNTPEWRAMVTCQEIGHAFGLDHQDEAFDNPNLNTCMDYTNLPASNQRPNQHDYDMLTTIYSHIDTSTTISQSTAARNSQAPVDMDNPSAWGKAIRTSSDGKPSMYVRDFGNNNKVFTFVTWAE